MRTRLIDLPAPELQLEWTAYSRLKFPNVFAPTQASYEFEDGLVIGQCLRKTHFEQVKAPRDSLEPRAYSIFDFGLSFEDRQLDILKRAGVYRADHVPIGFKYGDIHLNGEVDALVELDNELVGVEFKTGYGYRFLKNQILGYSRGPNESRPYLLDQLAASPKPEHVLQVACYLYYFTVCAEYPVPKVTQWRIVYQDRGSCAMAEYAVQLEDLAGFHIVRVWKLEEAGEYEVAFRQIVVEKIFSRFERVYRNIISGRMTERDFNPFSDGSEDWQCAYCVYKSECVRI